MSKSFNRRKFLGTSLAGATGASFLPKTAKANAVDANGDIRIAFLGVGGRGSSHVSDFQKIKGVRLVAVCDADIDHANKIRDKYPDLKLDAYQDYRKVLERTDVDGVVIATPNHWHTAMTIHACQAGKDVYVEKPATHNIWEGRGLIEAARKYNRIVQTGTQRRSDPGWHEAMAFIKSGQLGKIKLSRGLCYKDRESIGNVTTPQPVPASVDYNLWSGPAQIAPVMREKFHYDWHWFWPYGNGDIGNQGVHQTDVARWALGSMSLPRTVVSVGGRFGYEDDGETPNTQISLFDYPEGLMVFEVRGLNRDKQSNYYRAAKGHSAGVRIGNVIHCEGGYVMENFAYDNEGKKIKKFGLDGGGNHQENWIKAVRSRNAGELNAAPVEGHLSAAICHLANISHRLGKEVAPEVVSEHFKNNSAGQDAWDRFLEHLTANGVDAKGIKPVFGPVLEIDPQKEVFVGAMAEQANKHLSRDYRKEFAVTEKV